MLTAPDAPLALDSIQLPSQEELRAYADMGHARLDRYLTAEKYYLGEQQTQLTDRARQYLEASGLHYAENFCETVVDALADRLAITGISCPDEPDLASWIWETAWDRNRLDASQSAIHLAALEFGDAFVIVGFDQRKGIPSIVGQDSFMVKVEYANGEKRCAVKTWTTDERGPLNPDGRAVVRMNIYWPERIEKYFRLSSDGEGAWGIWVDEGDEAWPTPWMDPSSGEPLGIPVFHLANRPDRSRYGRAEHWGTIPQQDRLTKELLDLSAVLDTQGWPQRYATGVDNPATLRSVPGEVWSSALTEATFGQFDAADPQGLLKAIESTLFRIAARSRTPAHMIVVSGGAPSGESLKTAEAGVVAKAKDRALTWGEEWLGSLRLAAKLAVMFGQPDQRPPVSLEEIDALSLNLSWKDPETRNEKEHAEYLALLKDLGVSTETILAMIPGIDAQQEMEAKKDEDAASAETMANLLDRGGLGLPQEAAPGATLPPTGGPPFGVPGS